MGGCRCTYRNCTVKSDGNTHLYHYPVFDKVRCHQWLTNAQRLDFLDLKVSQLKNRVVCQHHFEDHFFMNFTKKKLTHDAVPTLDGPFCKRHEEKSTSQDNKMYAITLDDIENYFLSFSDKKATFSTKYGDFLTNNELEDMEVTNTSSNLNTENIPVVRKPYNFNKNNVSSHGKNIKQNNTVRKPCAKSNRNIVKREIEIPVSDSIYGKPVIVGVEFDEVHLNTINQQQLDNNQLFVDPSDKGQKILNENQNLTLNNINDKILVDNNTPFTFEVKLLPAGTNQYELYDNSKQCTVQKPVNSPMIEKSNNNLKKKKIEITEEKTVTGIFPPIQGKFEIVEPTTVLRVPKKGNVRKALENDIIINIIPDTLLAADANVFNHNTLDMANDQESNATLKNVPINRNVLKSGLSPGKHSISKMKTDKQAVIEEKRKFNMKMKNIIESCLDKLEERETTETKNLNETMDNKTDSKSPAPNTKVASFLSKEPQLPNAQEYSIACLEARMKRMEDILCSKIDQNTQRIMELKKSVNTTDKRIASTQTSTSNECYKKQLFNEISQFLSPGTNSAIYEELFINKFAQKSCTESGPSPKKRRRKCER